MLNRSMPVRASCSWAIMSVGVVVRLDGENTLINGHSLFDLNDVEQLVEAGEQRFPGGLHFDDVGGNTWRIRHAR